MKKYIVFIGLITLFVDAKKNQFIGYSYYNTAPVSFVSLTSKYSQSHKKGAIGIDVHYTSSYDSGNLARYLSPFDKEKLVVKENMTPLLNPLVDKESQDILSYNFNLVTSVGNFESTIEFAPIKKVLSCNALFYRQLNNDWWIAATVPFMRMETDMRLVEKIKQDGGGAAHDLENFNIGGNYQVGSMREAFASSHMKYGKIDGKRIKRGFGDSVVKIGRNYSNNEQGYVRPFMGMVLPMSNKPTAEYMFEPILGNAKHFGLLFGSEFGNQIAAKKQYIISYAGLMQMTYLLPSHHMRSFDPAGKPWGRYMAMIANPQDMAQARYSFGINECTKRAKIFPGIQYVSQMVMSVARDHNSLKLGYQTTVRASERVAIAENWTIPAIASLSTNEPSTNPARTINTLLDAFKDESYRGIQRNEVGVQTATHPFYIAHQLMVSCITAREKNNKKYSMECGGKITLGTSNAVPHEWAIHLAVACCL